MKINSLATLRYSITNLPNDRNMHFAVPGSSKLLMATTYEQLIQLHINQLKQTSVSPSSEQVTRNHMTALRAFLKFVHKSESSPVGIELTDDFDALLKGHLQAAVLSLRSAADRKSLLSAWRNSFLALGEPQCTKSSGVRQRSSDSNDVKNPFEIALLDALKNARMAPKTAAKRAGTSVSAIARWTKGAIPNATTTPSFGKLEATLGLPPGELLDAYNRAFGNADSTQLDAYRVRLKRNKELSYRLQESEVTNQLRVEWADYFKYKTDKFELNIKRRNTSRWTLVDARSSTLKPSSLWTKGNRMSPSGNIFWTRLAQFIGFLRLPTSSGGYGLTTEVAQTLAWVVVPDAVDAFMNFLKDRSDGLVHGAHRGFAAAVMALVHPTHGYLKQCPSFQAKLPSTVMAGNTWEQMCATAMQVASAWKSDAKGQSRDPSAPIQRLLDSEQPAAPVFTAMLKLRRIGNEARQGSSHEAILRRDELLLGLLLSNPLRCINLMTISYRQDNTGNVYQNSNGRWRIRIGGENFKNRERVGGKVYDVPVAGWLESRLSDYVKYFRPVLANGTNEEFLFLSSVGGRFHTLSSQVARLTKTYIPGCPGFRPHAFRHLVATDWLTKNHNDFLTVAELLNDTISVVMKNYAHLKKDVAFNRYEAYLQTVLPAEMAV